MQKIVLIPDSFKGTMSSMEICALMEKAIRRHFPHAEVLSIPVADGGEGSVDCFLAAMGGKRVPVRVKGPYGEDCDAFYGQVAEDTAIVEMAACAGLPLVGERKNPEETTTYGVGQLIGRAVGDGCRKIVVGLGGSATNDGGCGAAAALGAKFLNDRGEAFVPVGGTLTEIASIDAAPLRRTLAGVEIVTMCDIDNPLCGEQGAAAVFGPQKGADPAMVERLDGGLSHLARIAARDLGVEMLHLPGAGAAGGMGGGMAAFFGSPLRMGIETVLDTVRFEEIAAGAGLILTGEGKIDGQSLRGKVVIGVARRAKTMGIPVAAIVGDIGDDVERSYAMGVSGIFSINRIAAPFKELQTRCREDLYRTVDNLMGFIARMEERK
ncbi:glycerate kinase family protein [Zongyangia hominis]|uniref:Glycerate kinase n=1 Tax=Zongyangia hominis TaxID=2763677 RepID=A0A926I9R8_9FIRM|nr:glycerate kinase [Zongyangia hominis]MBC8569446.1 glycerate kinase [Zongyangia hominis]